MNRILLIASLLLFSLSSIAQSQQSSFTVLSCPTGNVLYVDSTATGANNGTSWNNAFTSLADAFLVVDECANVDTVLVAKGTYYPLYAPPASNTSSIRDNSFYIFRDNIALIGGYPSGGIGTKDHITNPTILSGNIGALNDSTDNVFHVVMIAGTNSSPLDTTVFIDGFTIADANGNSSLPNLNLNTGVNISRNFGGGIVNMYASPKMQNCIILKNYAQVGGGISNTNASPVINHCDFANNRANTGGGINAVDAAHPKIRFCNFYNNIVISNGGAILLANSNSALINNNIFTNNIANAGGGMYIASCNINISELTFISNTSTGSGGGIFNTSNSNLTISNAIFKGNVATNAGGGMLNANAASFNINNSLFSGNVANNGGGLSNLSSLNDYIINVTFSGNRAGNSAGALYNINSSTIIKNCIIWGNNSGFNNVSGMPTMEHTIIQNGYPGVGNINQDPKFVFAPEFNFAPFVLGDYNLFPCSPAINNGDTNAISHLIDTDDIMKNDRYIGAIDRGAYEFQGLQHSLTKLYVDISATGDNNGSSWANAFNSLSDAIAQAHICTMIDSILVAEGTYYPTSTPPTISNTTNRDRSFYLLRNGLKVWGGYPSGGGIREPNLHQTILSGDLDQSGTLNDNDAHHVIVATGTSSQPLDSTLAIDGFTITGGNANGDNFYWVKGEQIFRNSGGGILNWNNSSPSISNCNISYNRTWWGNGGGMYNRNYSSPIIRSCNISNNQAMYHGGDIFNWQNSSPSIVNCNFLDNSIEGSGGAIANIENSSPTINHCVFLYNTSNGGYAAAIYNSLSSSIIANSIISNNEALNYGGGNF